MVNGYLMALFLFGSDSRSGSMLYEYSNNDPTVSHSASCSAPSCMNRPCRSSCFRFQEAAGIVQQVQEAADDNEA